MGSTVGTGATTCGSIAGGFVRIDVAELAHAWGACRTQPLGIGDFRVWLAAREMVARRQAGAKVGAPTYGTAELAHLLDVSSRTAAAAVRRLVAAGLMTWAESAITFPTPASPGQFPTELADTIAGGRGPISIPRRVLRFLAKGAGAALIATALGALLRCLSRRRSGFGSRGRFKASWIARVFGVATRHTKAARAQLIGLGWLEAEEGDQWAWNRWGRAYWVRLDWSEPDNDRHPSPSPDGPQSSPPDVLHPDPLREEKNPEPALSGPAGASLPETGTASQPANSDSIPDGPTGAWLPEVETVLAPTIDQPPPSRPTPSAQPAPDLRDIRPEDLADTDRVLELHRQAVEQGQVSASEADRVRFVAAAEHARRVGKANPPGLFSRLIQRGWWHLLTQADEERAARRLRGQARPVVASSERRDCHVGTAAGTPSSLPPAIMTDRRRSFPSEGPAKPPSTIADLLDRLGGTERPLGASLGLLARATARGS